MVDPRNALRAALVVTAAACASDGDGAVVIPSDRAQAPTLDVAKSLVITSRSGFRDVADPVSKLTLGRLLADRHALMNKKRKEEGRDPVGEREGTLMAFTKLAEDVDDHNKADPDRKIGIVRHTTNPFRDQILANWDFEHDKDGPFRLLAVINRLDLAGANDNPGGGSSLPEEKRKFFGEGRLVFGLTAKDDAGDPYPMTLIMEYHLPKLKQTADGDLLGFEAKDEEFDADGILDDDWAAQRQYWATIWLELSRYELDSTEYRSLLAKIVSTFARAGNSITLRVGYVVVPSPGTSESTIREFEYRENYAQGGFLLAPRDLARDVHPCVAQQEFFAKLVEQRWQASTRDMNFEYKWPSAIEEQDAIEKACGVPFGAEEKAQGPRVHVSRFLEDKWWPALYGTEVDYNVNAMEEKRHDFAMTTCSGCHSSETATKGFMIFPRAENADSKLADFLHDRETKVTMPNGAKYTYTEIARRKQLLLAFLERSYPCDGGLCPPPPERVTSMQEEMLTQVVD
jgi:hypothetical protein